MAAPTLANGDLIRMRAEVSKDGGKTWTAASASTEKCAHCKGTGWRIGSVPCPYCDAPAPSPDAKTLDDIIAAVCAKHRGVAWGNSHREAMREVAEAFAQQTTTPPTNPTE